MTNSIATAEVVLPPVPVQVAEVTGALLARAANGTEEKARVGQSGDAARCYVERASDGTMGLFLFVGKGSSCISVKGATEARAASALLAAFADALDQQPSA